MAAAALARDPLQPHPPDSLSAGAMLALAVHVLLVLALAAGVNWRQREAETFSAEIWAALPERAAPRPTAPPVPEPTPAAPTPAPPLPRVAPPPPPARSDADIALERARERELERAAAQERERAAAAERQRAIEREREAEARRQREAEAALLQQQRELQRQRAAEAARQAEEARRAAALEAQRQANLKRMLGQAGAPANPGVEGATGGPGATGSAQRDAGPSATYGGRIRASILPNIVLTEPLPATLEAVVEVRAAGTGTILARRIVRSSGNAVWDEAVLRAIDRTRQLPRDTDGRVPPSIVITFRPE